ncbi:glycine-rich domain-containing protein [Pseudoluteimonas lycopersici]|uniref:glycine-rich domain-containing protein n=1 Tax=Pseudoluteimonas lycopersici TaxID=1324796 RepID=UPI00163DC766|nr:hypothetical protein [Lysobacter lycopersici]
MPTINQQIAAAIRTANSDPVPGFYWEIGDETGRLYWGSVGTDPFTGNPVDETTSGPYASASKMLYQAYVWEQLESVLSTTDWPYLNMSSGYDTMTGGCAHLETVHHCITSNTPPYGTYTSADDGTFHYDAGHFQNHANNNTGCWNSPAPNIPGMNYSALAAEYNTTFGLSGTDVMSFTQPLMAGGVTGNVIAYRAVMMGLCGASPALKMASHLGAHTITASGSGVASPAPSNENWGYSAAGCWVEPDGGYSSGGSFGFYPYLWPDRSLYMIVARYTAIAFGELGLVSIRTGQAIREAFNSGRPRHVIVGGSNFTVPSDWNSSDNTIHAFGGGQSGFVGTSNNGGGGADYANKVNVSLTPGASISINVGQGGAATTSSTANSGTDTWFDNTGFLLAAGAAPSRTTSVGDTTHAGGAQSNAGGSGAAGPHGAGNASSSLYGAAGDVAGGVIYGGPDGEKVGDNGQYGAEFNTAGAGAGGSAGTALTSDDGGTGGFAGGGGGGTASASPALTAGAGGDGALVFDFDPLPTTIVITSGSTWTVPMDCVAAKVECIGAGQSGWIALGSNGGGSGDYARRDSVPLTPGDTVTIQLGVGGARGTQTSALNGTSTSFTTPGSVVVLGKGAGSSDTSSGDVVTAGTAGGTAGGGSGAPGPNGSGAAGSFANGGQGDAGSGGAGGATGSAGGNGGEWSGITVGGVPTTAGAGGGGGASTTASGGDGGNYGAGGGGARSGAGRTAGAGANGVIVVTYYSTGA